MCVSEFTFTFCWQLCCFENDKFMLLHTLKFGFLREIRLSLDFVASKCVQLCGVWIWSFSTLLALCWDRLDIFVYSFLFDRKYKKKPPILVSITRSPSQCGVKHQFSASLLFLIVCVPFFVCITLERQSNIFTYRILMKPLSVNFLFSDRRDYHHLLPTNRSPNILTGILKNWTKNECIWKLCLTTSQ